MGAGTSENIKMSSVLIAVVTFFFVNVYTPRERFVMKATLSVASKVCFSPSFKVTIKVDTIHNTISLRPSPV